MTKGSVELFGEDDLITEDVQEDSGNGEGFANPDEDFESFDNFVPKGLEDAKPTKKISQTEAIDNVQPGEKEEAPKAKPEEEKPEEKEEEEEEEEETSSEAPEIPIAGKKLTLKVGDQELSIGDETTVRMKVDGKMEEVSLKDLASDFNGRKVHHKRFQELSEKEKSFQASESQFKQEMQVIQSDLKQIFDLLDREDGDPMEALQFLVDSTGRDGFKYYQKALEARLSDFENLLTMDDTERKLFWKEKELDFKEKKFSRLNEKHQTETSLRGIQNQADSLRGEYGISEDQYVDAFEALENMGHKDVSPEQVVKFAHSLPYFQTADNLLSPYADQLSDSEYSSWIEQIGTAMIGDKTVTADVVKKHLAKEFEVLDGFKVLNKKAGKASQRSGAKVGAQKHESFESFEDFDSF